MDAYSVIIKPHVTEKTMNLIDLNNEITFVVRLSANKGQIKRAFEDLWYDASEYFQTTYNAAWTSQIWWNIIADLRNKWRKDNEIKKAMEDLWYNSSPYFTSWTDYISINCNIYKIKHIDDLNVYTSDNLQKKEYFINQEYLKRYIDSKNPQKSGCPTNIWWISKSYSDSSSSTDKFIAPNWKVYFIQKTDGKYTSSELISKRYFSSILDLKYHIRDNNPLIWM